MTKYWVSFAGLTTLFFAMALFNLHEPASKYSESYETEPAVGEQMSLTLYRNPETRDSVLDFFARVAGNPAIAQSILTACDENNISPILVFALVHKESRFNPKAVGYNIGSRDVGLFQLNSNVYPKLSYNEATDPLINSRLGVIHLKASIEIGNDIAKGLAIYNAGTKRVLSNQIPPTTRKYVADILSRIEVLEKDFFQNIVSGALASRSSKSGKQFSALADSL